MVIGLVTARLHFPDAQSLKDKRRVLRSVLDRALNRYNVSVAEVGDQNLWQVAELAFVTVAAEAPQVQERISAISKMLETDFRFVLLDINTRFM